MQPEGTYVLSISTIGLKHLEGYCINYMINELQGCEYAVRRVRFSPHNLSVLASVSYDFTTRYVKCRMPKVLKQQVWEEGWARVVAKCYECTNELDGKSVKFWWHFIYLDEIMLGLL
jgi:hypothetical protein